MGVVGFRPTRDFQHLKTGAPLAILVYSIAIVSTGTTDYPADPFEPHMGIQGSCRVDTEGRGWGMNRRISVDDALRSYNQNGVYAGFEENLKSSSEIGKLAGPVVLSKDHAAVDPFSIKDIPVERTIVGWKTVYEA